MIDLSKDLPDTITVDGKSYLVNTDFRVWLSFSVAIDNDELTVNDIAKLFVNDLANIFITSQESFIKAIMQFLSNPNNIPRCSGNDERIIDYLEDSEFIYASFMEAYGIDLCTVNMHWHQFKALFIGLPDNSKYKQILAMRCADLKDKRKPEEIARENKRAWALPLSKKEKEEEEKKERRIAELLGEI